MIGGYWLFLWNFKQNINRFLWHSLFIWLCYRKWLMLFSLKLQRDNRQNALAVAPAKGKTGEKAVFSPHCGDEITTNYNRAFYFVSGTIVRGRLGRESFP